MPHLLRSGTRRKVGLITAIAMLAALLIQGIGLDASENGTIAIPDDYLADFSDGETKGAGLSFANVASGLGVDLRLRGFPGREANRRGKNADFAVAPGIHLSYEVSSNKVKETIVLDQPSPSEFRFDLNAPGLQSLMDQDEILLSPPGQPWMFRISKVVAWDENGTDIPASMSLKDDQVVVRLDRKALESARAPITVDPTIEGAPTDATAGPQSRRLFQTTDDRLVFFHRQVINDAPKYVYRVSTDQGETWGDPQAFADAGVTGDISATKLEDNTFLVVYNSGTQDLPRIAFKRLTATGSTWSPGIESIISTAAVWWQPRVTIADRGSGPLGRRLVAGFIVYSQLLNRWDTQTAFSEDTGLTWRPGGACGEGGGIVAAQGERAICVTSPWEKTTFSEWDGTTWVSRPQITACCSNEIASITQSDDGSLHLVGDNYWESVYYTKLSPGANQWSPVTWLASGKAPVISTTGTTLHVFAYDPQSTHESLIRTWMAPDGVNWVAGSPLRGKPFTYVLDHNQSWAFADQPEQGDILFSLTDANLPGGWIGNRIGVSRNLHRLDSINKKVTFGFTPSVSGSVSQVKIWATSQAAPYYRVGLQGDSNGVPSGNWLRGTVNGNEVDSYAEFTVSNSQISQLVALDIPETQLPASVRYHLVIQPACAEIKPGTGNCSVGLAGPDNWVEIEAVGSDPDVTLAFDVRTKAGTQVPWVVAGGEVPRVVLTGPSGVLLSQEIIPGPYVYGAMEYVVTGESFVPSQSISPSTFRLYLVKTGNPSQATIRLLDSSNTELWSGTANLASSGWVDLAVTGVSLAASNRYRLVVDHDSRDTNNYWALQPSGAGTLSWGGTSDALTSSHSRPGFSDRSIEASDQLTNPYFRDFVAFDSSGSDELYLGGYDPFDFAAMVRLGSDSGGPIPTSFSYWNGNAWAPLSLTQNDFLAAGHSGSAEFTPPVDWTKSRPSDWLASNGHQEKLAYWVRVITTGGAPTTVVVERATGVRNFRYPSVSSKGNGYVPLVFQELEQVSRINFDQFPAYFRVNLDQLTPHPAGATIDLALRLSLLPDSDEPTDAWLDIDGTFSAGVPVGAEVGEVMGTVSLWSLGACSSPIAISRAIINQPVTSGDIADWLINVGGQQVTLRIYSNGNRTTIRTQLPPNQVCSMDIELYIYGRTTTLTGLPNAVFTVYTSPPAGSYTWMFSALSERLASTSSTVVNFL